jgi:hypothetical protein
LYAPSSAPPDLDAHQLAIDPPLVDHAQHVAAHEILLLLELDHPLVAVANLVGVLLDGHVAAVREDASLDAPDVTRSKRRRTTSGSVITLSLGPGEASASRPFGETIEARPEQASHALEPGRSLGSAKR